MKTVTRLIAVLGLCGVLVFALGFNRSESREIEKLGGNPAIISAPLIVGEKFADVRQKLGPTKSAGACRILTEIKGKRGFIPGDAHLWEHKTRNQTERSSAHYLLMACVYKGYVVGEQRAFLIKQGKVRSEGESQITDRGLAERLIGSKSDKETVEFDGPEFGI